MAKLFYTTGAGGTQIEAINDLQIYTKEDLETQFSSSQMILDLGEELRGYLAQGGIPGLGIPGGFPDLNSFDSYLEEDRDRILDMLDYFTYELEAAPFNVRTGDWFTPIEVYDVSGELSGSEAFHAIDGAVGESWWQSDVKVSGSHYITFKVRDYQKKISKIRLRTTSGDLRAQLQGVTIRTTNNPGNIDEPSQIAASDVNFTYVDDNWMEYEFPSKKTAKYLKLDISGSLNSNDEVRIREIQVRVEIINHER